jgi:hypothetical protein
MVLPDEANADEAKYWETYSAKFAEYGAQEQERAARAYQKSIEQAELDEGIAAVFAKNRTVALKGERPMERVVVGELLAARRRCQYRASGPAAWSASRTRTLSTPSSVPGLPCVLWRDAPFRLVMRVRQSGYRGVRWLSEGGSATVPPALMVSEPPLLRHHELHRRTTAA